MPLTPWRGRSVGLVATAVLLVVAPVIADSRLADSAAAAADSPTTYQGYVYAAGASNQGPSADKPQSKLWYADGDWWALMVPPTGGGIHINRLDRTTHTWVDSGTVIDDRTSATSDALWDGSKLYTISRTSGGSIRVARVSKSGDRWSVDPGFPVTVGSGGTETATIAKDSLGVLWATWTKSNQVMVTHSTGADNTFTTAAPLPVPDPTVHSDDIAAVIAYRGRVGIMWSDHVTGSAAASTTSYMRFAEHVDGTGDSSSDWTVRNIQTGVYSSDDHINLKSWSSDPSGRVYAAFKTSYADDPRSPSSAPQIIVAARSPGGSVSLATASTVGDGQTRPQLVIDESTATLHVLMTAPESGGTIYDKTSALSNLSFGPGRGTPFITWPGAKINNVSVSKDPVNSTTGIVALAADKNTRRYYHAELGGEAGGGPAPDTAPPSAPGNLTATAGDSSVALSWSASTDNVGVERYVVRRDGAQVATVAGTNHTDAQVPEGNHTYTVVAQDAAGNTSSAASVSVAVTGSTSPSEAPSFEGVSRVAVTASASVDVPRPAGASSGDMLLAVISSRGNPTITAPQGWTLVTTDSVPNVVEQSVFSRVATDGDPATWSFDLRKAQSAVVGQITAYGGASGVTGSEGVTGTSGTVLSAPTIPVSGSATSVVLFSHARSTTLTPQPPLIDRGAEVASGRSAVTAGSADSTSTSGAFTAKATASSSWIAQTIVLGG